MSMTGTASRTPPAIVVDAVGASAIKGDRSNATIDGADGSRFQPVPGVIPAGLEKGTTARAPVVVRVRVGFGIIKP
jgi:hypothetical protein